MDGARVVHCVRTVRGAHAGISCRLPAADCQLVQIALLFNISAELVFLNLRSLSENLKFLRKL